MSTSSPDLDLEFFLADPGFSGPRPAILVLPGGGFREHTRHDGEGYARWLNGLGFHAAVLAYVLRPEPFPLALHQARAALTHLRSDPDRLGINPSKVGVIGSSAGGLLAGLLATGATLSIETLADSPPRPDFHIQSYGLADLALLPDEVVEELLGDLIHLKSELSPTTWVNAATPPTFVWATAGDPPGLPNALEWTRALAEVGVAVELHIYPDGWHGLGLADGIAYGKHGQEHLPHSAQWTKACETWLRHIDVLKPIAHDLER